MTGLQACSLYNLACKPPAHTQQRRKTDAAHAPGVSGVPRPCASHCASGTKKQSKSWRSRETTGLTPHTPNAAPYRRCLRHSTRLRNYTTADPARQGPRWITLSLAAALVAHPSCEATDLARFAPPIVFSLVQMYYYYYYYYYGSSSRYRQGSLALCHQAPRGISPRYSLPSLSESCSGDVRATSSVKADCIILFWPHCCTETATR